MKGPLLEASNDALACYLGSRRGTLCTMCRNSMLDGYCIYPQCKTYPEKLGVVFIGKFKTAIEQVHRHFKKHASLAPSHSKVVSGGRIESKRRKH